MILWWYIKKYEEMDEYLETEPIKDWTTKKRKPNSSTKEIEPLINNL